MAGGASPSAEFRMVCIDIKEGSMSKIRRSAIALTSALTLSVGSILALSMTAPGAAALRAIANHLVVVAHAGGGPGGFGGGVISITMSPKAELTAKLAATISVTYTCQPIVDPSTGNLDVILPSFFFAQVEQREAKSIAHGSGFANGTAVCDQGIPGVTPTVNQANIVVIPDFFPGFTSLPFKHGVALASVFGNACPNLPPSTSPPFFPPCDFGSAGPAAVSIK